MSRSAEEQAFLDTYDVTAFERPSVAVDVAVLAVRDGALHTLLVRRTEHPDLGRWSLPGGFVRMNEALDDAAARVLRDKAGLTDTFVEQLYTFGAPGRDPRTRVISVAYYALVDAARLEAIGPAARVAPLRVPWEGEAGGPVEALDDRGAALPLAFDHADQLGVVVRRLRGKLGWAPIGFELLPDRFTLRALQEVHETILGRPVNKDSFRRKILASGQVEPTGALQAGVDHRPAELYRFVR